MVDVVVCVIVDEDGRFSNVIDELVLWLTLTVPLLVGSSNSFDCPDGSSSMSESRSSGAPSLVFSSITNLFEESDPASSCFLPRELI